MEPRGSITFQIGHEGVSHITDLRDGALLVDLVCKPGIAWAEVHSRNTQTREAGNIRPSELRAVSATHRSEKTLRNRIVQAGQCAADSVVIGQLEAVFEGEHLLQVRLGFFQAAVGREAEVHGQLGFIRNRVRGHAA